MMKKMNSMTMSVIAWAVVFILALVVLWVTKAKFILKNPDSADKEIAWDALLAWSALFATIIAIIVLVVREAMGRGKGTDGYTPGGSAFRYGGSSSFRFCRPCAQA